MATDSSALLFFDNPVSDIALGHLHLEPHHDSTFMLTLYTCMAVFGIVGNITTCVVIASNRYMRTATNYYLFNLALSDLMVLVWAYPPFDSNAGMQVDNELFCKFRGLMAEAAVYVSIFNVTVFSVERYIAICHPFLSKQLSTLSRATKAIPVIWVLGLLCALPVGFELVLLHDEVDPSVTQCTMIRLNYYLNLASVLLFVFPGCLICIVYVLITLKLRESARIRANGQAVDRSKRRGFKMLTAVVAAFFVCWMPFHLQRFLCNTQLIKYAFVGEVVAVLYECDGVLYYSSAIINPILYNIMSKKFRRASVETFLRYCKCSCFSCRVTMWINQQDAMSDKSTQTAVATI